jgi:hypothetical protein
MAKKLITNRHVRTYQKTLGNVIDSLDRPGSVNFYVGSGIPTGAWDWVNNEPIDPNAVMVYDDTIYTAAATIRWFKDDDLQFTEGGTLYPGSVRVKCRIDDILASGTDRNGETYFKTSRKIEVDGQECELVSRPVKTGLRDLFVVTAFLKRVEDAD